MRKLEQKLMNPGFRECEEVREFMSDYVDAELDADARDYVDEHVGICPGCRRVLNNLRVTPQLIRRVSGVGAAAGGNPDEVVEGIAPTWCYQGVSANGDWDV